jgi:hypothetical protein
MNNQRTPERCGNIILAHADSLVDVAHAIGVTASMLRQVMTEQSLEDWPATWHPGRIDAVLTLIDTAASKLADAIEFAAVEGEK